MRHLYKHGDKWYVVVRYLAEHNVRNSDGSVNLKVLEAWRDYVGADHVLRDANGYMLCETVQDARLTDV